ncbi:MAG: hypothetical protein EHM20_00360 [Alphaproteobacteria bacterium]|nr:MAG: hypothetical protein EHM20_00360 [Alphaproteobacteria bacterium]
MEQILSQQKKLYGNKKGAGLIQGLVMGVAGLVIGVIISFVVVSTLSGAGLLTSGSAEDNATDNLIANFSAGINEVSEKIPTVLTIAVVVLILGVLVLLWGQYKKMSIGGGSEL